MKYFNYRLFFGLTLIVCFITFLAFNAAISRDEGTLGTNVFKNHLADFFNILRFPAHVLLRKLTRAPFMFAIGLLFNSLFYSFILERLFYLFVRFVLFRHSPVDE